MFFLESAIVFLATFAHIFDTLFFFLSSISLLNSNLTTLAIVLFLFLTSLEPDAARGRERGGFGNGYGVGPGRRIRKRACTLSDPQEDAEEVSSDPPGRNSRLFIGRGRGGEGRGVVGSARECGRGDGEGVVGGRERVFFFPRSV